MEEEEEKNTKKKNGDNANKIVDFELPERKLCIENI